MPRLLRVCLWALLILATPAVWADTLFTSTLDGASERPTPHPESLGVGTATGTLSGGPGSWVFSYSLDFSGLAAPLSAAHIHEGTTPAGDPPLDQFGGVRHHLDTVPAATSGMITGEWRFDDVGFELTDALADALLNGRTYFNLHNPVYPAGEIRGQIIPVPEPAAAVLASLAAAGMWWVARRRRAR